MLLFVIISEHGTKRSSALWIYCLLLFQNMELKDLLPYGFAIHHAGMAK